MSENLTIHAEMTGTAEVREEAKQTGNALNNIGSNAEKSSRRTRGSLGLLTRGFRTLTGAIGLTGIAFGLKDVAEAGMKLQGVQTQLRGALKSVGDTGQAAFDKIDKAAIYSSEHGGFGRDQEIQSVTQFIETTHSSTAAMQANQAAIELARRYGMAYTSAQRYIGQAIVGNVKRLQQYVGVIEPVKDAQFQLTQQHKAEINALELQSKMMGKAGPSWLRYEEMIHAITPAQTAAAQTSDKLATAQEVIARVNQKASGAIARFNATTQGKLLDLKQTFQEVTAQVGLMLLPVVNKLADAGMFLAGVLEHNKVVGIALAGVITLIAGAAGMRALVGGIGYAIGGLRSFATMLSITAIKGYAETAALKAMYFWDKMVAVGSKIAAAATWIWQGATTAMIYAQGALALATGDATGAMLAFDAAADANPIGAVILLVVALAAAIFELITHLHTVESAFVSAWHWIENAVSGVFNWIKHNWPLLAGLLFGPIGFAISEIITHFKAVEHFISSVWDDIKKGASDAAKWVGNAFKDVMKNSPLGIVGNLLHGNLGGALHSATFGLLWHGGSVRARGEEPRKGSRGSKHLYGGGPAGTDTVEGWLSPGEYVLNSAVTSQVGLNALDRLNAGFGMPNQGQNITITPTPITLRLDSRVLAEGIVKYTLQKGARGPSSLVGGALVTGV